MKQSMKTMSLIPLLLLAVSSAQGQVLLVDDFEDGVATDWLAFVHGWIEADGVFHATNTGANIPVEVVYEPGLAWTDYEAQVEVTPLSQHFPVATSLYFRWNQRTLHPEKSYAACDLLRGTLDGVARRWLWLHVDRGTDSEGAFTPFDWLPGVTYRLRVTAVGDQLTCEVVGHAGARVELASSLVESSGTVALRSTHIRSDFDNLSVTAIESCAFGPDTVSTDFSRHRGTPRDQEIEWESCGGPGSLVVKTTRVASAFVWLNGEPILEPSSFQNRDTTFEIPIRLIDGANRLSVEVRGRPGSRLKLEFDQ